MYKSCIFSLLGKLLRWLSIKKYLAKFGSTSDYNTFAESNDYITPNVSAIYGSNTVFYNPYVHDYSKDYLTFEALESDTFAFTNDINYSIDNGETWTLLSANTNTPTINVGEKIIWKAELMPTSSNGIGTFSSTGEFNVMGNAMSLLYGDNFIGQVDLTGKDYAFYKLFNNCTKLINTDNLSLFATTLASSCYRMMFQYCTSLTTAPVLPATILTPQCYRYMFYGCTSLNSITMLATNIPSSIANYCLKDWVSGVSASGTFTKASNMTSLPSGASGIPSSWTIQDYVAS